MCALKGMVSLEPKIRSGVSLLLAGLLGLTVVGCDGGGPDLTTPPAPSNLSATPENGEVTLTWNPVSEADTYNLYRSTSPGDGSEGSPIEGGLTSTEVTDPSVQNGTTYFYRVTAVTAGSGEEAESDPSGETQATPFAQPTELQGTSKDSEVELTWSEATGAESYNLYRDTVSTDEAEGNPLEESISQTTFSDGSAENGTTYYYRVTSVNPEGKESTASNEVEKTPFSDPPDRP